MEHGKRRHDGTVVFTVADLAQAHLERDPAGRLAAVARISPDPRFWSGNGAGRSTFDPLDTAGALAMA